MPVSRRLYRLVLLLYPRRYRERFGADQLATAVDLFQRAAHGGGRRGLAVAWIKALRDAALESGRQRLDSYRVPAGRDTTAPRGEMIVWDDFVQDLRLTLRGMRQQPGVTAAVLLTLGLGIGANTAIFSVGEAALLRSAPVVAPERLAALWTTCRAGTPRCSSSYPDYLDYRDRSTMFADIAAYSFERASLGDEAGARLVDVLAATGNYFTLLGVDAAAGRVFGPQDERERRTVAVISHDLWRDRFGSDPNAIGRPLRLNQAAFEVIGVTPEGFEGLHVGGGSDVYIPLLSGPALAAGFLTDDSRFEIRGSRWISQLIGRLEPGATIEQARAEMLAISDQLALEDPDARGPRRVTVDAAEHLILPTGSEQELLGFVAVLGGVVALTLLLACANLANLLLARATARRREIGVRLAMGASKARLIRQLLTESTLLALLGGIAGLLIGRWVVGLLSGYRLPGGVSIASLAAALDARVLLFTFALSLATGLVFGLAPALQAARTELGTSLRAGGRGGTTASARTRSALVAAQIALCLLLVTGSGLFLQAMRNGLHTDLGFPTERLAVATLDLSLLRYDEPQGRVFFDALIERLESRPGVTAAGVGSRAPLLPGGAATLLDAVDGYQPAADEELRLEFAFVDEGYLRALGLPIIDGSPFTRAEAAARPLIVINRDMAERWWPRRSAVGGRVVFNAETARVADVVAVTANTKWDDGIAADDYPFAFMPLSMSRGGWVGGRIAVLVRTRGDATTLLPVLRDEIHALEPDASLIELATMETLLADILMPQRLGASLLTWFGLLAVLLAGVGIYSVIGYTVAQRRREIGVRMALGAERSRVLLLVLRGILVPLGIGLAAGIAGALLLGRTIAGFMYGVQPDDPATIGAVAIGIVVLAAVAGLVPARRATRVDPTVALSAD